MPWFMGVIVEQLNAAKDVLAFVILVLSYQNVLVTLLYNNSNHEPNGSMLSLNVPENNTGF